MPLQDIGDDAKSISVPLLELGEDAVGILFIYFSAPPGAGRRCHWHIYLLIHNRMPLQDIGDDTNFSLKAMLFYFRELSELYFALSAKMLIILKVKARIYIPFQRLSVKFKCFDYKLILMLIDIYTSYLYI